MPYAMRPGWRHVLALGLGRSGGKIGAAFRQGLDPSPFINSLSEAAEIEVFTSSIKITS